MAMQTSRGHRLAGPPAPPPLGRPNRRRRVGSRLGLRPTCVAPSSLDSPCLPACPQLLEEHRGQDITEAFSGGGSMGHLHSKVREGRGRGELEGAPVGGGGWSWLPGSRWLAGWLAAAVHVHGRQPLAAGSLTLSHHTPLHSTHWPRARGRCWRTTAWGGSRGTSRRSARTCRRWSTRACRCCRRWGAGLGGGRTRATAAAACCCCPRAGLPSAVQLPPAWQSESDCMAGASECWAPPSQLTA